MVNITGRVAACKGIAVLKDVKGVHQVNLGKELAIVPQKVEMERWEAGMGTQAPPEEEEEEEGGGESATGRPASSRAWPLAARSPATVGRLTVTERFSRAVLLELSRLERFPRPVLESCDRTTLSLAGWESVANSGEQLLGLGVALSTISSFFFSSTSSVTPSISFLSLVSSRLLLQLSGSPVSSWLLKSSSPSKQPTASTVISSSSTSGRPSSRSCEETRCTVSRTLLNSCTDPLIFTESERLYLLVVAGSVADVAEELVGAVSVRVLGLGLACPCLIFCQLLQPCAELPALTALLNSDLQCRPHAHHLAQHPGYNNSSARGGSPSSWAEGKFCLSDATAPSADRRGNDQNCRNANSCMDAKTNTSERPLQHGVGSDDGGLGGGA
ncbi:hypothetical protein JZ751_001227 [Albula glossodonta]|uniref:Uncharacterized protein n=1 Tax=Albula glossodonta TaxID=121402 RepID=A0A8T2PSX9_9TELE|nr:hypothetical protein JZ751_001227 [Albula glossodonta]